DLKAGLAYRPQSTQPLSYDAFLAVSKAKLRHPKLPLPLEELDLTLSCSNGDVRLDKLTARAGSTEIEADGWGQLPKLDEDFECRFEARHLEMSANLAAALPEKIRKLYDLFRPSGLATFRADAVRRGGAWGTFDTGETAHVQLRPEAMAVNFTKFPYPLERM